MMLSSLGFNPSTLLASLNDRSDQTPRQLITMGTISQDALSSNSKVFRAYCIKSSLAYLARFST
uniref:Uncharacterized protein n=1 Tax=Lepeophtheirus salmonis TaxID=72036 RepID=A0A0K2VEZ2_LEPSM